ncbi:MAG: DUF4105 domain-containing protein [Mangrovicoccus sp.]|nr:DUF4105 domain-containing protein [Mangrovicoccus sp.]
MAIALITLWGALALWYRAPGPQWVGYGLCFAFALIGLRAIFSSRQAGRGPALALFALSTAALLGWWASLHPPAEGVWAPDVAEQVTGEIEGDVLVLKGVRDFDWQSANEATPHWITQRYDLDQLASVDLFLSYWAGPQMAHMIVSFGFADGQYLTWSVEVRRSLGGVFSPIADAFKANPLVIIAATEKDVIGLRTNLRKEDVRLFRLATDKQSARRLLTEYVHAANVLSRTPRWYNSITTNCTTVVWKMMRAMGARPSWDWRMIVNGYLPEYAYDAGSLNPHYSVQELRELGSVSPKGQAFGVKPGYSQAIREGVPKGR